MKEHLEVVDMMKKEWKKVYNNSTEGTTRKDFLGNMKSLDEAISLLFEFLEKTPYHKGVSGKGSLSVKDALVVLVMGCVSMISHSEQSADAFELLEILHQGMMELLLMQDTGAFAAAQMMDAEISMTIKVSVPEPEVVGSLN